MLCHNCGNAEAEVFIKAVVDGHICEIPLCMNCAGISGYAENPASFSNFSVSETGYACEKCGMTLDGIIKSGKAGCDECYNIFRDKFDKMISSVHGNAVHKGKVPGGRYGS